MRIFISGVNGFIGTNLINRILSSTDLDIIGIDIEKDRLSEEILRNQRFEFYHGDISISREWVEFQLKRADIVIP
jgi:nucleoside-diphosphate-sugar epimerase